MSITKRVGSIALGAILVAGLAACKKEKKDEGGDQKASGSGTASASGTGTGTASGSGTGTAAATGDKKAGGEAMAAIKGAIAKADGNAPPSGGGLGGMGAALGGLFGGGRAASADMGGTGTAFTDDGGKMGKKPAPTEEEPPMGVDEGEGHHMHGEDDSMPPEFANIKLPPAAPKGGDCQAVADRLEIVIRAMLETQFGTMDADTRKMVEGQMGSMIPDLKAEMLKMCNEQKWPQELKDCVLVAETADALQGCEQYVTEEMKNSDFGGGEPPEPPMPEQPAPAWSGGDDCAAVGQRIAQLAMNQAGELDEESKKMMEEAMAASTAEIVEVCTQGQWSADVRSCFLKAGTIQDAEVCFGNLGM